MSHQTNITRIKAVYNALGPLKDEVVFVGGATVSLYADRIAAEVRPTEDVDILVEIASHYKYSELEEQLRQMGFQNDHQAKFVGRYLLPGLIVDVMPTNEEILGFSNRWYAEGFRTAMDYMIDELHTVKIFTAPYFIASKLEAFKNRAKDPRLSDDLEDIVFVLENRRSIWEEIANTTGDLRTYLYKEFTDIYNNPNIEEWVDAHSDFYSPPGSYIIMRRIEDLLKTR